MPLVIKEIKVSKKKKEKLLSKIHSAEDLKDTMITENTCINYQTWYSRGYKF